MRFLLASAILSALAVPALTLPSPSRSTHVVHEKRDDFKGKWVRSSILDSDYVLPARIGLKQSNLDLGVQYLNEM